MDKGQVVLAMADGSHRRFEPERLPRNLANDGVTIYEPKQLALFAGDRIRCTDIDRERGLLSGDMATIERVDREAPPSVGCAIYAPDRRTLPYNVRNRTVFGASLDGWLIIGTIGLLMSGS